jgi:hypothetical protein
MEHLGTAMDKVLRTIRQLQATPPPYQLREVVPATPLPSTSPSQISNVHLPLQVDVALAHHARTACEREKVALVILVLTGSGVGARCLGEGWSRSAVL